ncbi:DUF2637 domain-containing protein [Streptomyces sp. NPDC101227]|uniref:DUF2637 domain-containing protein n=1 Tax=Streptomyces sp. NPDC101227 TaxID=3366136 RepID=UPI003814CBE5
MSHTVPIPARINGWDRAAIVALGGAGCALSYDALQQMAIAIHIRGFLTYVFPLVIDGFIAYGVRALLVLRTAPLAARCYVWLLFGTATAASIWANALHAVRLNQQQAQGAGLRLGDVTVGILSTLAPLALAGAVHLYILIARRITDPAGQPGTTSVQTDRLTTDRQVTPVGQAKPRPAPVTSGHPVELSAPETSRSAVTAGQNIQEAVASQDPFGQNRMVWPSRSTAVEPWTWADTRQADPPRSPASTRPHRLPNSRRLPRSPRRNTRTTALRTPIR